jgi:hypothetical protein
LVKTTLPDAVLAELALKRIRRHTADVKEHVHLCPTDAVSRLQSQCHRCPEDHLPQPVTLPELKISKSLIFWMDMRINIRLFLAQNRLLAMHLPKIARTIQISIQICWRMKEILLVNILSAVW